jgi:hypothetical protein
VLWVVAAVLCVTVMHGAAAGLVITMDQDVLTVTFVVTLVQTLVSWELLDLEQVKVCVVVTAQLVLLAQLLLLEHFKLPQ